MLYSGFDGSAHLFPSGTNSSVCLQFVTLFGGVGIKQMFGLTYVLTFVAGIPGQLAASVCSSFGGG